MDCCSMQVPHKRQQVFAEGEFLWKPSQNTHVPVGWLLAAVDELYPRFFPFALKRFRVLRCGASLL